MGVKLKIFIGYAILIIFLAFIICLFRGEQMKQDTLNREVKELGAMRDLTRKAYSCLLELASQGEVASIWDANDLNEYSKKRELTCDVLISLKEFVSSQEQKERIDSVCLLLHQKEILLSTAMNTFASLGTIGETVGEKLPAIVRQAHKQPAMKSTDATVKPKMGVAGREDSTRKEPEEEKRGFWKKLFGKKEKKSAYKKQQEEYHQKPAEKAAVPILPNNESNITVHLLHSLNREVAEKQRIQREKLFGQMDSLHRSSKLLNRRLNGLVGNFDKAASERLETRYGEITAEREESYFVAARLALFVFLLAIIFYLIAHRELNRQNLYRKRLEHLNREHTTLLAARDNMMLTVSHDLRAPLTVIREYADAMSGEDDREKRIRYYNAVLQSSDSMLALLNNLLAFYRLDMGKEQPENILFRLNSVVGALETAYRLQAEKKGLCFLVECKREMDAVLLGDRDRILQIGNNLLSNALKFTSTGSISLHFQYEKGRLCMEVSDTGMGIPPEQLESIFQPFEHLNNAAMQDGFGLGLAITNGLVELLHGEINVESAVGNGTTFKVKIPLPLADENTVREKLAPPAPLPEDLYVAVVDNDAVLLEMTVNMFTRNKIHCDGYHNARELLEGMRNLAYDIIVTDIRMPDINGFELLELLRTSKIEALKTIPVIAVSARIEKHGRDFLKAGFTSYLRKPFSAPELFAVVKSCIKGVREHPLPKADFAPLLAEEKDTKGMLELFVHETRKDMKTLEECAEKDDEEQLLTLVHHLFPIWESIRISAPLKELRRLLASRDEGADDSETLRRIVQKVITTGEEATRQAEEIIQTDCHE